MIGEGEVPEIANRKRMTFYNPHASNLDSFDAAFLKKQKELYNVNSYMFGCFGTIVMNKQHHFNLFTKGYIKELHRTIYAMEQTNDDVNILRFTAADDHTFSRGTDFKTLHHHSEHGEMDPIVEYLNDLYNFQIHFAKFNKPMFSTIKGRVENSANCLIGSMGISAVSQDTQ